MQRLRSTWMALMAGALLFTLSVSAAFGAAPASGDDNRGQSIASFVHELVFGADDDTDEDAEQEEENGEENGEEELDEENGEEELDEDADEELDEDAANAHGQCVAEEASDKSDEVDEDRNHGAVVSEAARDTCWDTDEADEDPEEELVEEDEELTDEEEDEEFDSHGACVSAAAHDRDGSTESQLRNHGKWVSQHARYTCWGLDVPTDEEGAADEASAEDVDEDANPDKADRANGKPSWAGNGGNGNGGGNGREGGRR